MPHTSKNKLSKTTTDVLEQQFISILRDTSSKARVFLFKELLTKTERLMIAKRIGIIFFLKKGFSSYKISGLLKVSPSTVERFERATENNGFRELNKWIYQNSRSGKLMKFFETLAILGLTGRTRSFKKFVDEL